MRESIRDRYAMKSERRQPPPYKQESSKPPSVWVVIAVVCFASFVIRYGDSFIMDAFPQTVEFFRPHQKQINDLKKRIEALEEELAK